MDKTTYNILRFKIEDVIWIQYTWYYTRTYELRNTLCQNSKIENKKLFLERFPSNLGSGLKKNISNKGKNIKWQFRV